MATDSEIVNQQDDDDNEDGLWNDPEDDEPEYYHCQTYGKTWIKDPGSNPCWDGGCLIDGVS